MNMTNFSALYAAINIVLYIDNTIPVKEAAKIEVPENWQREFEAADALAKDLQGKTLADVLPYDAINQDLAQPEDDALEQVCIGEATIQEQILNQYGTRGDDFNQVMEAVFDGELTELFALSKHGRD